MALLEELEGLKRKIMAARGGKIGVGISGRSEDTSEEEEDRGQGMVDVDGSDAESSGRVDSESTKNHGVRIATGGEIETSRSEDDERSHDSDRISQSDRPKKPPLPLSTTRLINQNSRIINQQIGKYSGTIAHSILTDRQTTALIFDKVEKEIDSIRASLGGLISKGKTTSRIPVSNQTPLVNSYTISPVQDQNPPALTSPTNQNNLPQVFKLSTEPVDISLDQKDAGDLNLRDVATFRAPDPPTVLSLSSPPDHHKYSPSEPPLGQVLSTSTRMQAVRTELSHLDHSSTGIVATGDGKNKRRQRPPAVVKRDQRSENCAVTSKVRRVGMGLKERVAAMHGEWRRQEFPGVKERITAIKNTPINTRRRNTDSDSSF